MEAGFFKRLRHLFQLSPSVMPAGQLRYSEGEWNKHTDFFDVLLVIILLTMRVVTMLPLAVAGPLLWSPFLSIRADIVIVEQHGAGNKRSREEYRGNGDELCKGSPCAAGQRMPCALQYRRQTRTSSGSTAWPYGSGPSQHGRPDR
jgi:hypothetical protein